MPTLAEKLAALDRTKVEMNIESEDGKSAVAVIYQRPTETDDIILKAALNDEYGTSLRRLQTNGEDGELSAQSKLLEVYTKAGSQTCIDTIMQEELQAIRRDVLAQLGKEPPAPEASQEERDEYLAIFKPAFEAEYKSREDAYHEDTPADLAERAAQIRISNMAFERAQQIYRRQLVVHSIFDTDGTPAFADEAEVAKQLPTVTIDRIANRVTEELAKARSLPLN